MGQSETTDFGYTEEESGRKSIRERLAENGSQWKHERYLKESCTY
ncbi:MAG: hypothetical protein JETT_1320 [Candidatus Jettenia ecosi]|uniref:Uncharacterized protein n=1 Tax=Candidatus Jettenia ecosi TaxID=2494326 RepID=A0A533QCC2_9BACT|nr:MAG: hypothetical protein JETT_1320 [Candidatus Jettenia ecosi]